LGQKVHPIGFRLGIHKGWSSNWFVSTKELPALIEEDHKVRNFLKKELTNAGVSRVDIGRKADHIQIDIYTARPGVVVGKGGEGIERLHQKVKSMINRQGIDVKINILEVNRVDLEAQLVAESIAQQLEKRVAFRRAMKQAVQRCMRAGAVGVKIMVSGRLGGAEIARTEWTKEGRIPLQTLRADIDYGLAEGHTVMGLIGIKVWIFRGELEPGVWSQPNIKAPSERGQGGDRGGEGQRGDRQGQRTGRGRGPKRTG
jgi:small subunit ribosomal protein S3